MLGIKNTTYKIQLLSGSTYFKNTTIKLYLQKAPNTDTFALHNLDIAKSDLDQSAKKVINNDNKNNIDVVKLPYQNPAFLINYQPDFKI